MSREVLTRSGRCLAVWLTVTVALATDLAITPTAWHEARPGASPAFADLLVATCATALLMALAWLWLVTSITVVELLTGRARESAGTTRRLVLLARGVAVLAGTGAPAMAADDDSPILAGLSLPDRSVTTSHVHPGPPTATRAPRTVSTRTSPAPRVHVVRPGESLWSIAETTSGPGDVHHRWRSIWAANRDVIGEDPDLILPGQELRLPTSEHRQPEHHQPDHHQPDHRDQGDRR